MTPLYRFVTSPPLYIAGAISFLIGLAVFGLGYLFSNMSLLLAAVCIPIAVWGLIVFLLLVQLCIQVFTSACQSSSVVVPAPEPV